jgi:hypothetical protein
MQETELFSAVIGALKSAFNDHGPITSENMHSAAKRIVGLIKAQVNEFETSQHLALPVGTKAAYSKRFRNVLIGRKKSRLALKLLIAQFYPEAPVEERNKIWNDVTKRARLLVNTSADQTEQTQS